MSTLPMGSARRDKLRRKLHASAAISAAAGDEEDAARKAIMNVVQLWLDRLQLVSVITTFFASIDGTLLSFTISLTHIGSLDTKDWSNTVQVMNASLAGALIFHVCSAITAFVGSFVLIRFKLVDASVPSSRAPMPSTPATLAEKPTVSRLESAPPTLSSQAHGSSEHHTMFSTPLIQTAETAQTEFLQMFQGLSSTFAALEGRVSVHQVRPFFCFRARGPTDGTVEPPVRLLSSCHTLAVTMAVVGFVLALLGILTFAWTALPVSIGAFASACLGTCLLALFATLSFC
ncbi:hypothetical protein PsYK624_006190 [Phanerochaete sordida]|uniref:Transmembrane protein n=1 Tax=Phanerochaete sordida TaxID=48140 RepID=A0A9P3FWT7_9APHY|nr:hypothetical protein PsYK624_006190 [Phanerochaete sordida]